MVVISRENQILINLVPNHWNPMSLGHLQKVENVLLREDGATGVRGIVVDDGTGVVVNLRVEVSQVDLPILFWQQIVVPNFDSKKCRQRLVEWKARSWR